MMKKSSHLWTFSLKFSKRIGANMLFLSLNKVNIYEARRDNSLLNFNKDEEEVSTEPKTLEQYIKLSQKHQELYKDLSRKYGIPYSLEGTLSCDYFYNIIDPVCPSNNLGKSVNNFHKSRIQRILKKQNDKLEWYVFMRQKILSQDSTEKDFEMYKQGLSILFQKIFRVLENNTVQTPSQ